MLPTCIHIYQRFWQTVCIYQIVLSVNFVFIGFTVITFMSQEGHIDVPWVRKL